MCMYTFYFQAMVHPYLSRQTSTVHNSLFWGLKALLVNVRLVTAFDQNRPGVACLCSVRHSREHNVMVGQPLSELTGACIAGTMKLYEQKTRSQ